MIVLRSAPANDGRLPWVYICANGKLLHTSGTIHDGRRLLYRASKRDCDTCPIRAKCCTTATLRKIPCDIDEDARDTARWKMKALKNYEMRESEWRCGLRISRLITASSVCGFCGLSGARDEFHLAAIVQNLKTLTLQILILPKTKRLASLAGALALSR